MVTIESLKLNMIRMRMGISDRQQIQIMNLIIILTKLAKPKAKSELKMSHCGIKSLGFSRLIILFP